MERMAEIQEERGEKGRRKWVQARQSSARPTTKTNEPPTKKRKEPPTKKSYTPSKKLTSTSTLGDDGAAASGGGRADATASSGGQEGTLVATAPDGSGDRLVVLGGAMGSVGAGGASASG